MELIEFITRLSHISSDTEGDRYWRVIVNLFFVEGIEEFQLGTLPSYFKQYYKRAPVYNGNLSALILEPRFKAICQPVRYHTALMVQPSEMVLKIISGQYVDPTQTERLNNNNNNIKSSTHLNSNTNTPLKQPIDSNVNLNPFKELAKSELEEKSGPNEFEQFGELALEEMNCCICLDLLKDAVEASCCSGLFCSECINQTIRQRGQNCPLCRANNTKFTINEPIRRLIRRKRIKCTNEKCPDWSTLGDIEKHRAQCGFRLVGCRHCKKEFPFVTKEQHESQCNQRPVTCQKCHKSMLFNALKSHNEHLCEMVQVRCTLKCGSSILRKNMLDHVTRVCPNRRVICQLHGCGQLVACKDLAQHQETGCLGQMIDCSLGCGMKILKRDVKAHEGACTNVKVPCPHAVHGCEQTLAKMNIPTHAEQCRFKMMMCPAGCGQQVKKLQLNAHKSQCTYTQTDCAAEFPKKDLAEHQGQCNVRPMPCPHCRGLYSKSTVQTHAAHCASGFDNCSGCRERIHRTQLDHHCRYVCSNRRVECLGSNGDIYPLSQSQLNLVCPGRRVFCSHCKRSFNASQIASHQESCIERPTVTCKICNKRLSPPGLLRHLPCPEELFKCKLWSLRRDHCE